MLGKTKSKNVFVTLRNIKKENSEELVSDSEAKTLSELKFKSGENILTFQDKNFLYEIVWLLDKVGYEKTYNFLSTDWEKVFGTQNIRKKMLFENPLLAPARDQFLLYMEVFKSKLEVSAGEKCKKCGSENTISISAQTRSADEAQTIKIQCLDCKFRWTSQ